MLTPKDRKAAKVFLNVKRAQGLAAARAFKRQGGGSVPMPTKRSTSVYKPRRSRRSLTGED